MEWPYGGRGRELNKCWNLLTKVTYVSSYYCLKMLLKWGRNEDIIDLERV